MAYLSLFTFAMLMLVIFADNLVQASGGEVTASCPADRSGS